MFNSDIDFLLYLTFLLGVWFGFTIFYMLDAFGFRFGRRRSDGPQATDRPAHGERGFTLVELAIVMMIIGLLIGGVLKGQELLANARVTSTLSQIKGYEAALTTFRDTFSSMPGDMVNATSRLPGCVAGNNCTDGNGNSLVSDGSGSGVSWDADITSWSEPTQFWKHLALANVISGIMPDGDPAAPAWGETHPSANVGGGFEFFYYPNWGTHVLRLSNQGLSGTVGGQGTSVLTRIRAAQMDGKMDDSKPLSGQVRGLGNGSTCDYGGTYDPNDDRKGCTMFFLFDQ